MGVLGAVAGLGLTPTGWGWGQAVPAEPALKGSVRGDLDPSVRASQFDPEADGPPPGVLAAEVQDRLQEGVGRAGVTTAGVVAGGQFHEGPITGLGLRGAADQIPDRAGGQVEPPSDLRRRGPEPGQAGDGQTQREFGGAWHQNGLPGLRNKSDPQTVPKGPDARNIRVGISHETWCRVTEPRPPGHLVVLGPLRKPEPEVNPCPTTTPT